MLPETNYLLSWHFASCAIILPSLLVLINSTRLTIAKIKFSLYAWLLQSTTKLQESDLTDDFDPDAPCPEELLNVLSDEEKQAEAQSGKFLVTFALVDSLLKNTKEKILLVSYSTKVVLYTILLQNFYSICLIFRLRCWTYLKFLAKNNNLIFSDWMEVRKQTLGWVWSTASTIQQDANVNKNCV